VTQSESDLTIRDAVYTGIQDDELHGGWKFMVSVYTAISLIFDVMSGMNGGTKYVEHVGLVKPPRKEKMILETLLSAVAFAKSKRLAWNSPSSAPSIRIFLRLGLIYICWVLRLSELSARTPKEKMVRIH